MKLNKNYKLVVSADGSAASGKTTGAKKISKMYGLKFLSSGLLYRYASFELLKYIQNIIMHIHIYPSSTTLKPLPTNQHQQPPNL